MAAFHGSSIRPVHKLLQVLLVTGYSDVLVLRVLTEAGVIGILALWIACLLAVRRSATTMQGNIKGVV